MSNQSSANRIPAQPQRQTPGFPLGAVDRVARSVCQRLLAGLSTGRIELQEGPHHWSFGAADQPATRIRVHHPRFYRRLLVGGSLGAGESYLDGDWSTDNLPELLRTLLRNAQVIHQRLGRGAVLSRWFSRTSHWLRRNHRANARRNIHEHYDLGNEFFRLFLDPTLNYSSGIFESPDATMEQASVAKMDRICRKLRLEPRDHLLEIGTGWGGLAMHAARHYGCRVTTTTISHEQFQLATERIAEAGLSELITVELQDYRDLQGRYDKLVSVEMIEAVGHEFLPTYFGCCSELLKPDGMMLIQGIVIQDQYYARYLKSVDFIRQYVFPGGSLPSIGALQSAATKASDMRLLHLEDIGPHYATTLQRWRTEFQSQLAAVRRLGFDDRFIRLWEYYLAYCEAGFSERHVNNVQVLYAKPDCRTDIAPTCRYSEVDQADTASTEPEAATKREPLAAHHLAPVGR